MSSPGRQPMRRRLARFMLPHLPAIGAVVAIVLGIGFVMICMLVLIAGPEEKWPTYFLLEWFAYCVSAGLLLALLIPFPITCLLDRYIRRRWRYRLPLLVGCMVLAGTCIATLVGLVLLGDIKANFSQSLLNWTVGASVGTLVVTACCSIYWVVYFGADLLIRAGAFVLGFLRRRPAAD